MQMLIVSLENYSYMLPYNFYHSDFDNWMNLDGFFFLKQGLTM
jgi:hypothetical protein